MRVVYQLSQRVMVMKEGRIVESGDVDEVYFHPQHPYTKELLEAAGVEGEEERPETDAGADGAAAGKGTDERRRADA